METKEQKIIRLWDEYIDVESYLDTKIALDKIDSNFFIPQENIRYEEDMIEITIPKRTIRLLRNNFPSPSNNQLIDKFPLSINLFPIKKTQKVRGQYHQFAVPLFSIALLSDVKKKLYDSIEKNEGSGKVHLKPSSLFSYTPNLSAFRRFFDIENEVFSNNVSLMHLLNEIVENKADGNMKELAIHFKKMIEKIFYSANDSKSLVWQTSDVLIFSSVLNDMSKNIRDMFEKIRKNPVIYQNSPLAQEYITGVVQNGDLEKNNTLSDLPYWYGAFSPKYALGKGQAIVLQQLQTSRNLIASQGAPGTGKTTLLMSVLADNVVKKALSLIDGKDFNNQILIVSTANKAVDNAADEFMVSDEFKDLNWIYFIAGKQSIIDRSLPRIDKLLAELKEGSFDEKKFVEAENYLCHGRKRLKEEYEEYERHNRAVKKQNIEELKSCLQKYEDQFSVLSNGVKKFCAFEKISETDPNFHQLLEKSYNADLKQKEELSKFSSNDIGEIEKHPVDKVRTLFNQIESLGFFQKIFRKKKIYKSILIHLTPLLVALDIPKKNLTPETAVIIIGDALESIQETLAKPKNPIWEKFSLKDFEQITPLEKEIQDIKQKIKIYDQSKKALLKYGESFGDYVRINMVLHHRKMFEAATIYNYQRMLKKRTEYISALRLFKDFMGGSTNKRSVLKQIKNQMGIDDYLNKISTAYPIVTSSLAASSKFVNDFFYSFHAKKDEVVVDDLTGNQKPFHMIFSDESGMMQSHSLFPLLCFADKALVVGDPKQLPPIITMDGNTKIQYEHQYGEDTNALMYSPATVSAYHRASSAKTGHHNDIGNSIILEEHRRCQPPIAEAFVEIAEYVGMKIETQPLDLTTKETQPFVNMGGKPFLFYDVVGRSKSRNTNLNEADTIVSVVKKLLEAGYSYQDIGIITPYAAQESLLKRRLSKEDLQNKIQVGTIHKFQGVEFNVILFSSVIFLPEHSSFFINSAPNMLNVALSRAKQLFVVVGCLNKLQKSSGFLEIMCRHILENGEVYEVMPPDTHSKPKNIDIKPEVGIEIIDDTCRHLTIVEESYAKVKKELIIVSPWIREYSRKDYSNFQRIKKVVADGINVKVFYGYVGEKFGGDASKYEETTDQKLVQQFKTVLGKNLVRLSAGTHEKVLIVDRKEMYIGSFNWLSNQYPSACKRYDKGLIRRESTTKILDQNTIQRYVGALLSTTSRK